MNNRRPLTIVFSYASFRFTDSKVGKGGEEYMAWEIISRLAARGHRCHVYSPRIELAREYSNIIVHPIAGCDYFSENRHWVRLWKVFLFQIRSRRSIRRLLASVRADVIHHLVPAYPGFSSSVATLDVPFFYGPTMVRYDRSVERNSRIRWSSVDPYMWLKVRLWNRTLRQATKIFVEVDYAKRLLPNEVRARTVRVLKAADFDRVTRETRDGPDDNPTILFLAGLRRNKGVDVLLKAIPAVRAEIPRAQFLFVGPNHEPALVSGLVEELSLNDIVEFAGPVAHDLTADYYRRADIYCLPSRQDNAPATLFEALAQGVPIVAASVMGIPEVVEDGINGYLVPPGDPEALADAIVRILRSPETLRAMRAANLSKAENELTWEHYLDHFENAYREAVP